MSNTVAFPKILHIGDKQISSLFDGEVEITEKVDGCVTPDTGILMADLSYKPAMDLKIGDEVIGFDEELNNSRFRKSYITALKDDVDEVYELLLEDGRKVNVTHNHPLVVRFAKKTSTGLSKKYVEAKDIKVGMRIVDLGKWEHEKTYESGYVAGQYDGEGSLVGKSKGKYGHLSYYQNEGKGALLIKELLQERGFNVGYSSRQRSEKWGVCETLRINGGTAEKIKFLGTFRPQRLLNGAFEKLLEGLPFNSVRDSVVVGVRGIGTLPIVRISTSTKTYVADGRGYAHNQWNKFYNFEDVGGNGQHRTAKFAVAFLRVMWQCEQFLLTGEFKCNLEESDLHPLLKEIKPMSLEEIRGKLPDIMVAMDKMERRVSVATASSKYMNMKPDIEWIESFIEKAYTQ